MEAPEVRQRKRDERKRRREADYLIDEGNLELFTAWYVLNGGQGRASVEDVKAMTSAERHDFSLIMSRLSDERQERKETPRQPASGFWIE